MPRSLPVIWYPRRNLCPPVLLSLRRHRPAARFVGVQTMGVGVPDVHGYAVQRLAVVAGVEHVDCELQRHALLEDTG